MIVHKQIYKQIVETINQISGSYHSTVIFNDWVEMTALAFVNTYCPFASKEWKDVWDLREQRYLELAKKHQAYINVFSEMVGMLAMCFEQEFDDYLGKIYMELDAHNAKTGQFFTPFHISELTARLTGFTDEPIVVNEPSCGGGGMIIAKAKSLKERGYDYQKNMRVIAQDLSVNSCYMCYVQMSLIGINGVVIQGDTLAAKTPGPEQMWYTPKAMGVLL